jgi:hypothetical protein
MHFVIVYLGIYMYCHHSQRVVFLDYDALASATQTVSFWLILSGIGVPGNYNVDGQQTADVGLPRSEKRCR